MRVPSDTSDERLKVHGAYSTAEDDNDRGRSYPLKNHGGNNSAFVDNRKNPNDERISGDNEGGNTEAGVSREVKSNADKTIQRNLPSQDVSSVPAEDLNRTRTKLGDFDDVKNGGGQNDEVDIVARTYANDGANITPEGFSTKRRILDNVDMGCIPPDGRVEFNQPVMASTRLVRNEETQSSINSLFLDPGEKMPSVQQGRSAPVELSGTVAKPPEKLGSLLPSRIDGNGNLLKRQDLPVGNDLYVENIPAQHSLPVTERVYIAEREIQPGNARADHVSDKQNRLDVISTVKQIDTRQGRQVDWQFGRLIERQVNQE